MNRNFPFVKLEMKGTTCFLSLDNVAFIEAMRLVSTHPLRYNEEVVGYRIKIVLKSGGEMLYTEKSESVYLEWLATFSRYSISIDQNLEFPKPDRFGTPAGD